MKLHTTFLIARLALVTTGVTLAVTPLHADITRYYDAKGNYTGYSQTVTDEDLKVE
jgi:hypothetical protein